MTRRDDSQTARVGVVTVAFRSNAVLPDLLDSLERASEQPLELVVVDNLPGEGSLAGDLAAQHGGHYLPRPDNPGYGGGMNAGVAALPASVEWVLLCNPDVVLMPGSVDALLAVAMSDKRIAIAGPAIRNADETLYPSARSVPSLRTGIGHALFVTVWQSNPWTSRYRDERAPSGQQRDAGWLSGACILVRRSVFEQLGGFDEGYFMYFEDVDLGYRAGLAGYRNVFAPSAAVIHTGAHATTTESARMVRVHHDSARRFLRAKYRGWWLWPVRVGLSAALRVRAAWVVRRTR
ncbi:MAG: glycosyltransferase family 2 protein [Microcella sp.]|uniref:glycosyltransferase family 2 protein n=1 Tax=Microcella sp. TaxID=1913979 RepID=UPI00331569CF